MPREYSIGTTLAGTTLQVTEDGQPTRKLDLHAASDQGRIREAEEIINREYFGVRPFPGFDWQPMSPDGHEPRITTCDPLADTDHRCRGTVG